MNRLKTRQLEQRRSRGFTLMETLCALTVSLLVLGVIAATLQLCSGFLRGSRQEAQAQSLCAALSAAISDELRYARAAETDASGTLTRYFSQNCGEYCRIAADASGRPVLQLLDSEEERPLLGEATYLTGLKAGAAVEYSREAECFRVHLQVQGPDGEELCRQDFSVRALNP